MGGATVAHQGRGYSGPPGAWLQWPIMGVATVAHQGRGYSGLPSLAKIGTFGFIVVVFLFLFYCCSFYN